MPKPPETFINIYCPDPDLKRWLRIRAAELETTASTLARKLIEKEKARVERVEARRRERLQQANAGS